MTDAATQGSSLNVTASMDPQVQPQPSGPNGHSPPKRERDSHRMPRVPGRQIHIVGQLFRVSSFLVVQSVGFIETDLATLLSLDSDVLHQHFKCETQGSPPQFLGAFKL